ncbi:tetratricopeptide repeat protein [Kitasatospora sp. NPDC018058]|uniref:tetratricopeptide repeat protein n=1 Tax=Kitasatospora sp. NPDC018058 TaxID=3364025 RepID=UPI0037C0F712
MHSARLFALDGAGRHTEAETLARKALARHPGTGLALGLARALAAQGRRPEATAQLTRCATAWREHFGARHPYTVAVEADLAALARP